MSRVQSVRRAYLVSRTGVQQDGDERKRKIGEKLMGKKIWKVPSRTDLADSDRRIEMSI